MSSYYYSLDRFTKSYIESALWSSTISDEGGENDGDPLDSHYSGEDISDETLKQMEADCKKFRELAGDLMSSETCLRESGEWDYQDFGAHDFWLTRNHHGAGFWDSGRWTDEVMDKLTEIAQSFPEVDLYVGDDGQVWS